MNMITTKNGTQMYYKDWGKGPVVTFSHGWPLNADMWAKRVAINGAKDVYYPSAPHGPTVTHQDQANRELLAFVKGS